MATETTDILSLPYIMPSQAQKHVTHNEAIAALDVLAQTVVGDETAAPPDAPEPGDRVIVAPDPTGAFAGRANAIAVWRDGGWVFLTPGIGWTAYDRTRQRVVVFTGTGWEELPPPSALAVDTVGVNAAADAANRLAVASAASLFTHEGTDHRLKVNKAAEADTASLLYQNGYSGRAEMGLAGSDDFAIKVSPDGASWKSAMSIDRASGRPSFPQGVAGFREVLTANRTYHVDDAVGSDANNGLTESAAFKTPQKALDTILGTLDLGGYDATIQLANGVYTGALRFTSPQIGAGDITLSGDTATPSNVWMNVTGACITVDGAGCRLFVLGVKFSATAQWFNVSNGGYLKTSGKNEFSDAGSHGMQALRGGIIEAVAPEILSGATAGGHYNANINGIIYCQGATWTMAGTVSRDVFAWASNGGKIYAYGNTATGALTGTRYSASLNAVVTTNGGGASYFPGSVAGGTSTGGQHA